MVRARRGSVLLAVTLALGIVAAVAFAMTRDASFGAVAASAIAEGAEARYVAEAGLQHALWRARRANCSGYDLPSTPFGPHTYAARFTPTAGSPVEITATGTLASGATARATGSAVRLDQAPVPFSFMPGPADGQDAYLDEDEEDKNLGGDSKLAVSRRDGSDQRRSLLRFDLSAIPFGSEVHSAELELHLASGSGSAVPIDVFRVTERWIENEVTWDERSSGVAWSNPGGDHDPAPSATVLVGPDSGEHYSGDVTSLFADWVSGRHPNHGMLLRGGHNGVDEEFLSSDDSNSGLRPRIRVDYVCECGIVCQAPQGTGDLLLVVRDAAAPDAEDQSLQATLESWGYTVTRIDDDRPQADFDAERAGHAAVYVSATVASGALGTKLTGAPIGVVSEQGALNTALQIANGAAHPTGTALNVLDAGHAITQIFGAGPLRLKTDRVAFLSDAGGAAPGAQVLAEVGGEGALVVLETGAPLTGGAPAPARRVMLPLGPDPSANWAFLNNNGRLLVQRAIDWAMGGGVQACETFRDEFDAASFSNDDGSLGWAGPWQEDDPAGSGPSSGNVRVGGGVLSLDDNPNTGGVPSLARSADLSAFGSATLRFDFALGDGVDQNADVAVVQVSADGGASWTELEDFSPLPGGTSGSRSYTLSSHLATDTTVRIAITQLYGGSNEYFAVDDLEINACPGPPPLPIAHWKLDDASGSSIAIDSVGGHDGTLGGGTWTSGWLDGGLELDGAGEHVSVPDAPELSLVDALTLSAWVRNDSLSGFDTVLTKSVTSVLPGGSLEGCWLGTQGDEVSFGFHNGDWQEFETAGVNLSTDTWYHLAASFHDAYDEVRIYVDGAQVLHQTTSEVPQLTIGELLIGTSSFGEHWSGVLDDVRIYDRALSPAAIAALAAASGGSCFGSFADDFETGDYTGSTGSLAWSTDWQEINEDGDPHHDDERVRNQAGNQVVQVRDNDGGGEGIEREADLSASLSATLSFQYWRKKLDNASDYVTVEVSDDGGSSWSVLDTIAGPGTDGNWSPQSASHDISGFIAPDTRIRFLTSPGMGHQDAVYFDDVEIAVSGCAGGG